MDKYAFVSVVSGDTLPFQFNREASTGYEKRLNPVTLSKLSARMITQTHFLGNVPCYCNLDVISIF